MGSECLGVTVATATDASGSQKCTDVQLPQEQENKKFCFWTETLYLHPLFIIIIISTESFITGRVNISQQHIEPDRLLVILSLHLFGF